MDINKQIKELNRLKRKIEIDLLSFINTENRISLSYQYCHIIELLNMIDDNNTYEILPFIKLKHYNFKHSIPYRMLFENTNFIYDVSSNVINSFNNITLEPNKLFYIDNQTFFNTKQKMIILKSFLENIDPQLGMFLNNMKNNIIYHDNKNDTYGRAFSFPSYDKYCIYINQRNRVSSFIDTYVLAHEIGHVYEDKFVLNRPIESVSKYDNYYSEVCSTFFDTTFLNFANDYLNLKEANYMKEYKLNEIFACFKTLNFLINNINISYDGNKYKIPYYKNLSKNDKKYIKECDSYLNNIKYGYGTLVGTYFANLYHKDKIKGLTSLKEFLNGQCYISCNELYNDFIKDYSFLKEELEIIKRTK
jgi:Zn-dependent peptidase ImmA (M78 family)